MRNSRIPVIVSALVVFVAACGDGGGSTENRKAPVVTSFTASAQSGIAAGSEIMLAWETSNADMVTISERDPDGTLAEPFYQTLATMSGAMSYVVRRDTALVLTAYNMGSGRGPATQEIALTIEPPIVTDRHIQSLMAVPGMVVPGESVDVLYDLADVQPGWRLVLQAVGGTVSIEHAITAAGSVEGTFTTADCATSCPLDIEGYTTLGARLLDDAGATRDYRETGVGIYSPAMPIILQFEADDYSLVEGDTTRISWEVRNATSISVDPGVALRECMDGTCVGYFDDTPTSTSDYTLTAIGTGGTRTATITVTVTSTAVPPTVDSFSAAPASIRPGTASTLSWTTSLADTVSITAVPADASLPPTFGADDNTIVHPAATTTYTITATNAAGSDTDTATVTIVPLAAGDLVITEIMANPLTFLDADAEWFEILNPGSMTINLDGLDIVSGSATFAIATDVLVAPGYYAVLAVGSNPSLNDGLPTPDVVYAGIALDEPVDDLSISDGATIIDAVAWDATWSFSEGLSWSLLPTSLDSTSNDLLASWCGSGSLWSGATLNFGTPGAAHSTCD